jgi:hypothetical protein
MDTTISRYRGSGDLPSTIPIFSDVPNHHARTYLWKSSRRRTSPRYYENRHFGVLADGAVHERLGSEHAVLVLVELGERLGVNLPY